MSTPNPVPATKVSVPFIDYRHEADKGQIVIRAKNADGTFLPNAPVLIPLKALSQWTDKNEETGEVISPLSLAVALYAQRFNASAIRAKDQNAKSTPIAEQMANFAEFSKLAEAGKLYADRERVSAVKRFDEAVIAVALANASKAAKAKGAKPPREVDIVAKLNSLDADQLKAFKEKYAKDIDSKREEFRAKVREAAENVDTVDIG